MRVKNGKFYARWRDEGGVDHRKSFRTKRDAERFQQQIQDEIRVRKLKGSDTVGSLAIVWLESHSKFQDHRDRFFSKRCVQDMIRLAGSQHVSELSYMVPNGLIDEWKKQPYGKTKSYAPATVFGLRFRLKNLLVWFIEHGGSPELVKRLAKSDGTPQARQIIAEAWEIEQLKAIAPPWMKCFLLLCLDGGLRTAEALTLCPLNYSEATACFVLEVKKRRLKNFHASEELKALLAMAPAGPPETPYVTLLRGPVITRGHQIRADQREGVTDDHAVYLIFRKMLDQIGSKPRHTPRGLTWLHPHDLRRTIATWMYWKTKNIRQVQEYLGHAHVITTLRYIVHANTAEILPLIEDLKIEKKGEAVMQMVLRRGAGS
jgi:integrase